MLFAQYTGRNIFTYSSDLPISYVTAPVSVWFGKEMKIF